MKLISTVLSLGLLCLLSCSSTAVKTTPPSKEFRDYWYQGQAELDSYVLEQARYGEVHEGHAVLIFVTENFSSKTKSKTSQSGGIPILKCNFTKKFTTGVYPYSMMSSIHTAIDKNAYPHNLKVSTTSQEWCGHTFMDLDLKGGSYDVELRSYFESESEQDLSLKKMYLEDDIWTTIRIHPESLPIGELEMLPSTMYLRLKHKPIQGEKVFAAVSATEKGSTYTLEYPEIQRSLSIQFESAFPHKILSWEETYSSGWGANAKKLTTKATLNKTIMSDYWNRNRIADRKLRDELGLPN